MGLVHAPKIFSFQLHLQSLVPAQFSSARIHRMPTVCQALSLMQLKYRWLCGPTCIWMALPFPGCAWNKFPDLSPLPHGKMGIWNAMSIKEIILKCLSSTLPGSHEVFKETNCISYLLLCSNLQSLKPTIIYYLIVSVGAVTQVLSGGCKLSARGTVACEGLFTSKFTHLMAGRTHFLTGWWRKSLSSSWAISQRPPQVLATWPSP